MPPTSPPDQTGLHPLLAPADSAQRFTTGTLNTAQLARLIEAARWTPSSGNRQPWRFMLGCRGDTTFSLLRTALNPAHQSHTRGAAALLLALAQTADQQGVPMLGAEYELGMAVSRICVQARAQDWQCRQLGDFDHQRLRQELGVPAGFEPIVVLVVGGNGPAGPDDQAEYGTRLAPEAIAFARRWGRPAWTSL